MLDSACSWVDTRRELQRMRSSSASLGARNCSELRHIGAAAKQRKTSELGCNNDLHHSCVATPRHGTALAVHMCGACPLWARRLA